MTSYHSITKVDSKNISVELPEGAVVLNVDEFNDKMDQTVWVCEELGLSVGHSTVERAVDALDMMCEWEVEFNY